MDSTPLLTRPEDVYSRRRVASIAFGAIALGLSFTTGLLLADEAVAPTTVTIPQPIVVASAPIPVAAPTPAPVPVEPPTLRMAVPVLAAECFGRIDADGDSPACSWDTGFPAISNDGRQIAELVIEGPMGPTDVSVVFHDVATNKQTRTITISREGDFAYDQQDDPQIRAKIIQRTAAAQRVLDTGKFRALRSLGTHRMAADPAAVGDAREIHAEWSGATMRLIEPGARTELWRHTFSAPSPKPSKPDEECGGWSLAQVAGWWDPQTGVVVGQLLHHHGGCMCGSTTVTQVFSL